MENSLKRINEIDKQLKQILVKGELYGSAYFCSDSVAPEGEELGIESLYLMFIAELNRLISINNAYSAIASSCENGNIYTLFSYSSTPEHFRTQMHKLYREVGRSQSLYQLEQKLIERPKYIVPLGIGLKAYTRTDTARMPASRWNAIRSGGVNSMVKNFRDFVDAKDKNDLVKFKISFNEWYQTFVQGVLQKSEYFQTPELMTLSARIWNRYCDYLDFRESDALKQSILDVQALIDERERLVFEWREADKQSEIKKWSILLIKAVAIWACLFMYFSNILILLLISIFALSAVMGFGTKLFEAKNRNLEDWCSSLDWHMNKRNHPCGWH